MGCGCVCVCGPRSLFGIKGGLQGGAAGRSTTNSAARTTSGHGTSPRSSTYTRSPTSWLHRMSYLKTCARKIHKQDTRVRAPLSHSVHAPAQNRVKEKESLRSGPVRQALEDSIHGQGAARVPAAQGAEGTCIDTRRTQVLHPAHSNGLPLPRPPYLHHVRHVEVMYWSSGLSERSRIR